VSKCEQDVKDQKRFDEEGKGLTSDLNSVQKSLVEDDWKDGGKNELEKGLMSIRALSSQKSGHQKRLNALTELGEKLILSMGPNGIESVQSTLDQISDLLNSVYAHLASHERSIQEKLGKCSAFEEAEEALRGKLKEFRSRLPDELDLKSTLDEKRQQLNSYRNLLNDVTSQKSTLLSNAAGSPLVAEYETLLEGCRNRVGRCEGIVSDHSGYMSKVQENQDFMTGVGSTVALWSEPNSDRLTLQSNLHKLQNLLETLPEEGYRIEEIRNLGKKVLPDTGDTGRGNIQKQIDTSQQEWEGIQATVKSAIGNLQRKVGQFEAFEDEKEKCLEFLKEAELKMHGDLQPTLELKQTQLNLLQVSPTLEIPARLSKDFESPRLPPHSAALSFSIQEISNSFTSLLCILKL